MFTADAQPVRSIRNQSHALRVTWNDHTTKSSLAHSPQLGSFSAPTLYTVTNYEEAPCLKFSGLFDSIYISSKNLELILEYRTGNNATETTIFEVYRCEARYPQITSEPFVS